MRSVIIEEIIFGVLRPWVADEHSALLNTDITLLATEHGVSESDEKQWAYLKDDYGAVRFFGMKPAAPFDRSSAWYQQILEKESEKYLGAVLKTIAELEADLDRGYELNVVIRYLVDLLHQAISAADGHEDKLTSYVLEVVAKQIMQNILELGTRFPELDSVDQYDVRSLYMEVLDRQVPEDRVFYKTADYYQFRFKIAVENAESAEELSLLNFEVRDEMEQFNRMDLQGRKATGYEEIIIHIEDAIFLMFMDAAFIRDDREKMLDSRFCREWVQGTLDELMESSDAAKASQMFNNFLKAANEMERLLGRDRNDGGFRTRLQKSLEGVRYVFRQQLKGSGDGFSSASRDSDIIHTDFVDSFRQRFITVDEFDEVLPSGRDATMRYIKEGDIRVLEISREVKFLYREDVETFIEERTV